MKKYYWQRWHHPQGRANALRRLGVRGRGVGVAWSRRGARPMACHVVVQQALKTQRLNRAGFVGYHGNSRAGREAALAGLNRRMRKIARTAAWED